jgi:hypothetical protein
MATAEVVTTRGRTHCRAAAAVVLSGIFNGAQSIGFGARLCHT